MGGDMQEYISWKGWKRELGLDVSIGVPSPEFVLLTKALVVAPVKGNLALLLPVHVYFDADVTCVAAGKASCDA